MTSSPDSASVGDARRRAGIDELFRDVPPNESVADLPSSTPSLVPITA